MRIHSNCLGRALLATFAASTIMIGSLQARAAVSDQLVVNIGNYQQNETETEPAKKGSEEDGILLVGVPMLPSGTGYVRINDKGSTTMSDLLFYGALGNSLTLYSDVIPPDVIRTIEMTTLLGTVNETGNLQPVGKLFGLGNDNAIRLMSDLNTPEPSTWGMMLIGCGGLGYAASRSRKQNQAVPA